MFYFVTNLFNSSSAVSKFKIISPSFSLRSDILSNSLSTIASSNILLVLNNMNNLITENYIENEFLGIFLVINNNNFNSISFNEFCKTSQDISIPKNSYNYVFDNTKYFIEDNE